MSDAAVMAAETAVAEVQAQVNGKAPEPATQPGRSRDERGRFAAAETQAREVDAFNAVLEREAQAAGRAHERFTPGAKPEPPKKEEQPQPAKAEPEAKKVEKTAAQDKSDAALEQAAKVLALDGYEKADLDALGRDRVIALSEKASKRHAKYSQELELARKAAPQGEAAAPKVPEAPKAEPIDLKAAVKPLAELLGLGDEAEPALTKFAESITGNLTTELQQTKKSLDQVVGLLAHTEAMQARGKLPEEYRGLTDDAEYEGKVVPQALARWSKRSEGEYNSFEDALREAVMNVAGPRLISEVASVRAKKTEQREHGQLSPIEQRSPPKPKSADERGLAVMRAIDAGVKDLSELRAVFGS